MDDPQAFPGAVTGFTRGMSLRDWFAGQALTALGDLEVWATIDDAAETAHTVYRIADAMLKERSLTEDF